MYAVFRLVLVVTALVTVLLLAFFAAAYPLFAILVVGFSLWRGIRSRCASTAHGTARWAKPSDIPHLFEGNGVPIGQLDGRTSVFWALRSLLSPRLPSRLACRQFLWAFQSPNSRPLARLTNAVHVAVFGPSGAGKGVSFVIPFLLSCPNESMVVVDFKGELYEKTAQARRKMGHRVVILDPFKIKTRGPDTFNPLACIDKDSEHALDDCRDLAEALVLRHADEKEPHWADSAELWLAAMIALVAAIAEGKDKSLQSIRPLLTDPERMQTAIRIMCESDAMDGMLSRLGHQLSQFKEKELASVLTTTNRMVRFQDSSAVAESTSTSSFDAADLLKGKMTIYLVLPTDRVRALAPLLRMWISSLLRAVVKGGLQETTRVHFVLDEAATLGQMDAIDDALDKLRGYGVRLFFLWQSLGQLKKSFPDGQDQTLLANCTQVFFAVQDQQTAEYVSARLGEKTIVTESGGWNDGRSAQHSLQGESSGTSSGRSRSWQFMGRKLLKPEEVTALPDRVAITFMPGTPPIATRLVRYYERAFKKRDGMGPVAMVFHAACLIAVVVIFVLMVLESVSKRGNF